MALLLLLLMRLLPSLGPILHLVPQSSARLLMGSRSDVLPCGVTGPCLNGGHCRQLQSADSHSPPLCVCPAGFIGSFCEIDVDECSLDYCRYALQCDNLPGDYLCHCIHGWEGKNCSERSQPGPCLLAQSSCRNGATCVDVPSVERDLRGAADSGFLCQCAPGFVGRSCELEDPCLSNPCHPQHSVCRVSSLGMAKCECHPGFSGEYCENDINECITHTPGPCAMGATCLNIPGSFRCVCPHGFQGDRCDEDVDECASSPCLNGGTCNNREGTFLCLCKPGFSGDKCETRKDACVEIMCLNNGTCHSSGSNWTCQCQPGFHGRQCEVPTDECASRPCMNNGTCVDLHLNFTCLCLNGTTGQRCEQDVDECSPNPCLHGGQCENFIGGYRCHCPPTYVGGLCQRRREPCELSPCFHGGTCIQDTTAASGFRCLCPPQFMDELCLSREDRCKPNPCLHGGSCRNLHQDTFDCLCPAGFEGLTCESRVDPCLVQAPCRNGGSCLTLHLPGSLPSTYRCQCTPGFEGEHCEMDKDECALEGAAACGPHGKCVDLVNGFRCSCLASWAGEGCERRETDPCHENACGNGALCVPLKRGLLEVGYECLCNASMGRFTGKFCTEDVNECQEGAFSPCLNGGRCINTLGSFACKCASGFQGAVCENEVDDCAGAPCLHGGTCVDRRGNFTCLCAPGFEGLHCERNSDECATNPCRNGATCVDHLHSYQCVCPPGFQSRHCEDNTNDCSDSMCLNGGTCVDQTLQFICVCAEGFAGKHCELVATPCATDNPCGDHGTCVHLRSNNSLTCRCQDGYGGAHCERLLTACEMRPNLCGSRGVCVPHGQKSFHCVCDSSAEGERCEVLRNSTCHTTNTSTSELLRCHNGGVCVVTKLDVGTGAFCKCTSPYEGTLCELRRQFCTSPKVCWNGGTCQNGEETFSCVCPPGFTGQHCEQNVDDCASQPCKHGGTCFDGDNHFTCACPPGTSGRRCEVNFNECASSGANDLKCWNKGECVDLIGGYRCICPRGYIGNYCEADEDECWQQRNPHQLYQLHRQFSRESGHCFPSGTSECIPWRGGFKCSCLPGFSGPLCAEQVPSPCEELRRRGQVACLNGGVCKAETTKRLISTKYECSCPSGFSGPRCEQYSTKCEPNPCHHGGLCRPGMRNGNSVGLEGRDVYHCECPVGLGGLLCEADIQDECETQPCFNGGICEDGAGRAQCKCPESTCGNLCQFSGSACLPTLTPLHQSTSLSLKDELRICEEQFCHLHKANNHHCDEDCNLLACHFDAGECLTIRSATTRIPVKVTVDSSLQPWKHCGVIWEENVPCHRLFANGKCDPQCNSEACLYDGWDCDNIEPCPDLAHCADTFSNGHCDVQCNTLTCGADATDCYVTPPFVRTSSEHPRDFLLSLHVVLPTKQNQSVEHSIRLLRHSLSALLHTDILLHESFDKGPHSRDLQIPLYLDSSMCLAQGHTCFRNTSLAAQFLLASALHSKFVSPLALAAMSLQQFPGNPLKSVRPSSSTRYDHMAPLTLVLLLMLVFLMGLCCLVTVLSVIAYRTKWRRRLPSQEALLTYRVRNNLAEATHQVPHHNGTALENFFAARPFQLNSMHLPSPYFSFPRHLVPFTSATARSSFSLTQFHGECLTPADDQHQLLCNCETQLLTPQSHSCMSVSDKGLECEVFSILTHRWMQSGDMVLTDINILTQTLSRLFSAHPEMVTQLWQICWNPESRECVLHQAARLNDSAVTRLFLSWDADVHSPPDKEGHFPWHTAAITGSVQCLQLLLESLQRRDRAELDTSLVELISLESSVSSPNVNVEQAMGTCLLLAMQNGHQDVAHFILHQLANSPVSPTYRPNPLQMTDPQGRTALHWASSSHRLSQLVPLLLNIAPHSLVNTRTHDNETPLFLAAQAGLQEVCTELLAHGADSELCDHLGRSPCLVALEGGFAVTANLIQRSQKIAAGATLT